MGRAKLNPSLADQENDGFRFALPILRMTDARHAQERRYEHASCIPQPAAFFRACFRGAAAFFARTDSSCPFFRTSNRSEEHTSELQSLMRISYAVFCLKKKHQNSHAHQHYIQNTIIKNHHQ